jgi:hypothetical protein
MKFGLENIVRPSAIQKHCEYVNISIFECFYILFTRFAEKKFFLPPPLSLKPNFSSMLRDKIWHNIYMTGK